LTAQELTISVLTSCTSQKIQMPGELLRLEDFARGPAHVAAYHRARATQLVPAEQLYRGQQHLRLMRGVVAARKAGHNVSVSIISAGYGLLAGDTAVAPYECSFRGMSRVERRAWAKRLRLPDAVQAALRRPVDLSMVLVGEDYFDACDLAGEVVLGAPTLVICGARAALRLQPAAELHTVVLRRDDTRRFSCGLVGLKGEVAGRLLSLLAYEPGSLRELLDADPRHRLAAAGSPGVELAR
jgi:hypothetical protein